MKCNSQIEREKSFLLLLRMFLKAQQLIIECRYENVMIYLDQIFFNYYAVELDSKNILDRFIDDDVFQRFLFSRDVIINRRSLRMRQMMNSTLIIIRLKNEFEWKRNETFENIIYLCNFILLNLTVYIICNYVKDFINENEIFTQN
jgi:hypothetical protein